jgi:hypothetical protein
MGVNLAVDFRQIAVFAQDIDEGSKVELGSDLTRLRGSCFAFGTGRYWSKDSSDSGFGAARGE